MGCGSSASVPQDPDKFPSHLLFQFTDIRIKSVALQRNDLYSKEHVFQVLLQAYRFDLMHSYNSAQMDLLGQFKSPFIRVSQDNCSLHLPRTLWSFTTPVEFWNAADAGKVCCIKISLWARQILSERVARVDDDAAAEFVGDVRIAVGGSADSEGGLLFSALRETSRRRIKVETMSPMLLSTSEVVQKFDEHSFVAKDELNTQVVELKLRFGSCNRSASELEELLNQHMMEALHTRRLAQKLLHILEYARRHGMKAPHCSSQELQTMSEALKASKKTVERTIMIQEWSAKCSCSCNQIAQLLAIMRYDEERAIGLAHLIMHSHDGHEGSELLKLCNVFDTDAKLESAFVHVNSFYATHCQDQGFKQSAVSTIKRGGSHKDGSGSEHEDARLVASSTSKYSPVPAIRRAGSHDDDASEREQETVKTGVSRQPSSVEP